MDRRAALERMEMFQLSDARHYVLNLVQAAVGQGATYVDIRIDTDDMWMRFDGTPFTVDDLDDLFVAVFRRQDDRETRSLRELGLGVNAARGVRPRWIRVISRDENAWTQLEIRARAGAAFPQERKQHSGRGNHSAKPLSICRG